MNNNNLIRFRGALLLAVAVGCSTLLMSGGLALFALQGAIA